MSTPQPKQILIATWEGGGSVPPNLGVARRLLDRGHRVRFLSDACNRAEAEAVGAEFVAWSRTPHRPDKSIATDYLRDWEGDEPLSGLIHLRDRLMFGLAQAHALDVRDALARRAADLVISTEIIFGPMVGAEACGARLAIFAPNVWLYPTIPGHPPVGPGLTPPANEAERQQQAAMAAWLRGFLAEGLPALNAARAAVGLAPLADPLDQIAAADRVFLATSRAFDYPIEALPPQLRFVGPVLDEPQWSKPWRSPWADDDQRPLVLVSFSTTFQDQRASLTRVVEALGRLPVRGIVTTGPSLDLSDLDAPANVHLCRSAPHGEVMRRAALVVTHAGHGTLMRALVHDLPVLCMPMGRDQNDNAARAAWHGAGLRLAPNASSNDIQVALDRLLRDPSFRAAARRLGGEIRTDMATSPLIEELELLAEPPRAKTRPTTA